jgi:hypothetical protein
MKGATALTQVAETNPLTNMGSRLFTNGPTSVTERLAAIDMRLSRFANATNENGDPIACVSEEAKAWTLPADLPGGASFPIYLQCFEGFDGAQGSKFQIAFGIKDDVAYLIELQTAGSSSPGVATLARAKMDGTSTEAWITMQNFDNSQTKASTDYFFLGIKADDTSKAFEVTVSGSGQGLGLDCGSRVRSDGTNVYAKGIFTSHGGPTNEDCSGDVTAITDACVDAATSSEVTAANCAAFNTFTLPELTYQGLAAANGKAASDALINATISGVTTYQ